jgi:hypothetical protein
LGKQVKIVLTFVNFINKTFFPFVMPFFKPKQPILQKKQLSLDTFQFNSLKCFEFSPPVYFPVCGIYTCIDQSMVLWGLISALIFMVAQFSSFSWIDQAIAWSIITLVGSGIMITLTYSWTVLERLSWLLFSWVGLMLLGIILTDMAIALSWGWLLGHLCSFWLFLSSIGYLLTGFGMRSRAFFLATAIHLSAIFLLPYCIGWQFLATGLVMMSNLLIFAEGQWDMILPSESYQYSLIIAEKIVTPKNYQIIAKTLLIRV